MLEVTYNDGSKRTFHDVTSVLNVSGFIVVVTIKKVFPIREAVVASYKKVV